MKSSKGGLSKARKREERAAYLMLLPNIIGLFVFLILPIIGAFYISLHDWNGMTPMKFIGIDNYLKLFRDQKFFRTLGVTLKYSLIYVIGVFCISLGLAVLLTKLKDKFQSFFRTAFFLPYAVSTVIAALLWSFMYDPMRGYINQIVQLLGGEKQGFLADTNQALVCVVVVAIWLVVGYNAIIFLAGIKDIPSSYIEAARIDGAGGVCIFFRIIMPLLRETIVFVLITTTIGSFQAFDLIKVMTNGGPALSTNTTVYYIFRQAFEVNKMGYASAVSFIMFIIIMILTGIQFVALRDKEGQK